MDNCIIYYQSGQQKSKPVLLTRLLAFCFYLPFSLIPNYPFSLNQRTEMNLLSQNAIITFHSSQHHLLDMSCLPFCYIWLTFPGRREVLIPHLPEAGRVSSSPSSEIVTCTFVSSLVSTSWTLKYKLQESRESCLVYCCPCNTQNKA